MKLYLSSGFGRLSNERSFILAIDDRLFYLLTGASAIFEIVRSCGCFDAIPLTPWDSFVKDLILLFFIFDYFHQEKQHTAFEIKKNGCTFLVISSLIMVPLSIMLDWWAPFTFLHLEF